MRKKIELLVITMFWLAICVSVLLLLFEPVKGAHADTLHYWQKTHAPAHSVQVIYVPRTFLCNSGGDYYGCFHADR